MADDSRDQGEDRDTNVWLFRRGFVKYSVDRNEDRKTVRRRWERGRTKEKYLRGCTE